jgi:hypothetical protein
MDNRYFATANKETNENYLGPAPLDEMARYVIPLTFALLDGATQTIVSLWYITCALFSSLRKLLPYLGKFALLKAHLDLTESMCSNLRML